MPDHDQLIQSEFSRQAAVMATAAIFNDANVLARIRDAGRLTKSSRVLDVACGPGIVVEALACAAGEVVGCDITPEMLKVVTMVYAGYINKNIVAQLQSHGCNALGICGADGNIIFAHRRIHPSIDYGFVGDIDTINTGMISDLLSNNITLVVAPITHDGHGQLLNTNADTIAQEIAKAMSSEYDTSLFYSFEKNGVLTDVNDESSVIRELHPSSYKKLKGEEKITAGMIPKLDNAFSALKSGVKKVVIGRAEHLKDLVTGNSGTQITNEH